ncbi:MAG: hypothetical protein E7057_00855 [Lentisphaerae bacterium]|nr:hypothetical protein [Lentisphaerota bacterium]
MDETLLKQKVSRLIVPAALILPVLLMTANLTYDEWWSLLNFAPLSTLRILTDLSLPNNHPLNTLCLKILHDFSSAPLILRLSSLISGAFVPLLCGEMAWKWSRKNRMGAFVSAAVLSMLCMPLAVYSGVARGYTLQLFFLLLCVWAMSSAKDDPRRAAVWCVVGGMGTILSVPTGALFLLPAGIGYLIYSGSKERKSKAMWIAAGILAVFAGIFYGINFQALRAGQKWGEEISSVAGFGSFLYVTLTALVFLPVFLASVPAWIFRPERLLAAGLLMLPLVLALFSNAGPARTYLYLPAAIAVAAGIGIAESAAKFKKPVLLSGILAIVLGAGGIFMQYSEWKMVDYAAEFSKVNKELPADVLPVYRASCGYPIICGVYQDELMQFDHRMARGDFRRIACMESVPGEINALDENQSETNVMCGLLGEPGKAGNLSCMIYELHPVETAEIRPGKGYLLLMPAKKAAVEGLKKNGRFLYLNAWFAKSAVMVLWLPEHTVKNVPDDCRIWRIGR